MGLSVFTSLPRIKLVADMIAGGRTKGPDVSVRARTHLSARVKCAYGVAARVLVAAGLA
jgi:hypothetical protein